MIKKVERLPDGVKLHDGYDDGRTGRSARLKAHIEKG